MGWLIYIVAVGAALKLAFDFVGNTGRIASSLEDISRALQTTGSAKSSKETEKK